MKCHVHAACCRSGACLLRVAGSGSARSHWSSDRRSFEHVLEQFEILCRKYEKYAQKAREAHLASMKFGEGLFPLLQQYWTESSEIP
eukprot:3495030-Rhodomonas_salina.2